VCNKSDYHPNPIYSHSKIVTTLIGLKSVLISFKGCTFDAIARKCCKNAPISYFTPVFPVSACMTSRTFDRILIKFGIYGFLLNSVDVVHVWLKSDNNNGHFTSQTIKYIFFFENIKCKSEDIYRSEECSEQNLWNKIKHILLRIQFFRKSCGFRDNYVELEE
jgi:hypothetical protein